MSINYVQSVSSLLPGCSMNQFSWSALGQGEGGVLESVCVVSTWPRQTGGCLNHLTECQIGFGQGALPNRGGTPGKLSCMYRNSIQGKEDKKTKKDKRKGISHSYQGYLNADYLKYYLRLNITPLHTHSRVTGQKLH